MLSATNAESSVLKGGSFWLAEQNRPAVDPLSLNLTRLTIARRQISGDIYPFISFGADGLADYAKWQICPRGTEGFCLHGISVSSDILPGPLEAGKYTLTLQLCVHEGRSLNPGVLCAFPQQRDYEQPVNKGTTRQQTENLQLQRYEAELKAFGPILYQILRDFQKDFQFCQQAGSPSVHADFVEMERQVIRAIEIQIENLLNLGEAYLSESLASVRLDDSDDELARILVADVDEAEALSSEYQPKGLSLTTSPSSEQTERSSDALITFFQSRTHSWSVSGRLVPDLDIRAAILGSSGLTSSLASGLYENPEDNDILLMLKRILRSGKKQSGQERSNAGIFAGILTLKEDLSLNLTAQKQRGERYAQGEMTRAMLFLAKPEELPSCHAWERAEAALAAVRKSIRIIREQLASLTEKSLNISQ